MKNTRIASALAMSAAAVAAGCHFIKVNGKPLGGGSPSPSARAPSSSSSASSSSPSSSSEHDPAVNLPEPGKPAASEEWCAEVGIRFDRSSYKLADFADIMIPDPDPASAAGEFAGVMCTSGEVSDRDQIMAVRAKWMKAIDIDERDFTVLAARSRNLRYESQDETKFPGPLSQRLDGGLLIGLDRLGTRASMYTRFDAVDACLTPQAEHDPLLRHILCTREQLDPAKAYAEIDSVEELNNGTRYRLRKSVKESLARWTAARAKIAARAKADPGVAKLVEIADAQFKEWASPSPARAKLVQQLEAMEAATAANKHSAFAGCEDTTVAAWEEHLKNVQLPKVSAEKVLDAFVGATLDSTEGYLAYEALRLCAAGKATFHHEGSSIIGSEQIRRGPRTATIAAWLAAGAEIKFDDRALSLGYLLNSLQFDRAARHLRPLHGVIEKIEEGEAATKIVFKRVVEPREECLHWQETNRVEGVRPDGTLRYREVCKKWGTVMMNVGAKPLLVTKLLARGLKPGMFLVGVEGTSVGGSAGGYAIVATANAKSTKPIWVLGGSVK